MRSRCPIHGHKLVFVLNTGRTQCPEALDGKPCQRDRTRSSMSDSMRLDLLALGQRDPLEPTEEEKRLAARLADEEDETHAL